MLMLLDVVVGSSKAHRAERESARCRVHVRSLHHTDRPITVLNRAYLVLIFPFHNIFEFIPSAARTFSITIDITKHTRTA